MTELKRASVREFRDHATAYPSGSDPIVVGEHGDAIGIYVPLEQEEAELSRAIEQVDQILGRLIQETAPEEKALRTDLILARIRLHAQRC